MFDTVFVDYTAKPAMERPGLRSLLDVVEAFRPSAVLIPAPGTCPTGLAERAQLLDRFRSIGSTVIAVRHGKASTLVVGAGRERHG
jgi:hypothetical protein